MYTIDEEEGAICCKSFQASKVKGASSSVCVYVCVKIGWKVGDLRALHNCLTPFPAARHEGASLLTWREKGVLVERRWGGEEPGYSLLVFSLLSPHNWNENKIFIVLVADSFSKRFFYLFFCCCFFASSFLCLISYKRRTLMLRIITVQQQKSRWQLVAQ